MADGFDPIDEALAAVIRGAASPQIQEAQVLLLRRLALEGSVLPSRIPAPLNITEVGGYLNLLSEAGAAQTRSSAIASALGLASPEAISWDEAPPLPGWAVVANDTSGRPALVRAVSIRADLAKSWSELVQPKAREIGATIPLWGRPPRLPAADEDVAAFDLLECIGRRAWLDPGSALANPETDPIVLGRADADSAGSLRVMARVSIADVAPVPWNALAWDDVANVLIERPIGAVQLIDINAVAGLAGFRLPANPPRPARRFDLGWGAMTNLSGLLPGVSRLSDELRALWTSREISRSALASKLDHVWDGRDFVAA